MFGLFVFNFLRMRLRILPADFNGSRVGNVSQKIQLLATILFCWNLYNNNHKDDNLHRM